MYTEGKTIGGYLELQLPEGKPHFPLFIPLNTGRNAFEYLLRIKKYDLVYLPFFSCEVLMEPLQRLRIPYRFYHIDEQLNPILDFEREANSCLMYPNYFGIKTDTVRSLAAQEENLIIDNAQAFFQEPIAGLDTFYSCRKFFGVPDGAYLYTESNTRLSLESDISAYRCSHLIKSIDLSIEIGYHDYLKNNIALGNSAIKKMSVLSRRMLRGIDYEACRRARNENFQHLHAAFSEINELTIALKDIDGPMVYPLLLSKKGLRADLIAKKIFVASYWPNVLEWTTEEMFEHYLATNLIALPIDHRYSLKEMDHLIEIISLL